MDDFVLQVKDLKKYFKSLSLGLRQTESVVYALDGVSFDLQREEVLCIVGESGCGKSTLARVILRLIEPTSGEIFFGGNNITRIDRESLKRFRKDMQLIFQDPYSSLNPKLPVSHLIGEGLRVHRICEKSEIEDRVGEVLKKVGLKPEQMRLYPHEFSGGQRQRIAIARALVLTPKLIIGDEPVSALDVSIQAQIINLLEDLKKEYGLSYIVISHDLDVVKHISDRVAVMYLGRLVEMAFKKELYRNPQHPYTQALLSAIPAIRNRGRRNRVMLKGETPSPSNPPTGCSFHTRCYHKKDICPQAIPLLRDAGGGHFVACHLLG